MKSKREVSGGARAPRSEGCSAHYEVTAHNTRMYSGSFRPLRPIACRLTLPHTTKG